MTFSRLTSRPLALLAAALLAVAVSACTAPVEQDELPPTTAPVALFLGDSYTEGTGLPDAEMDQRWSTVLAESMGWEEVNAGCAGSGYATPGFPCDDDYVERIEDFADVNPDVVVVSGGANDHQVSPEQLSAAIEETFATLRETFPDAAIVAVGGVYLEGAVGQALFGTVNEDMQQAADAVDGYYVSLTGATLADRDALMGDDGVHPNPDGHELIAQQLVEELAGAGIQAGVPVG